MASKSADIISHTFGFSGTHELLASELETLVGSDIQNTINLQSLIYPRVSAVPEKDCACPG